MASGYLACGCANYNIYYYDLRDLQQPLCVLEGHKNTVSYCQFLNNRELVSLSTDSEIKLWDINAQQCLKSYRGHSLGITYRRYEAQKPFKLWKKLVNTLCTYNINTYAVSVLLSGEALCTHKHCIQKCIHHTGGGRLSALWPEESWITNKV